jgi:hypothetical protein
MSPPPNHAPQWPESRTKPLLDRVDAVARSGHNCGMSLPNAVLRLSTDVLADINDDERLAFAYAQGPALSGFGEEAELVCVWETNEIPEDASDEAVHLTVAKFQELLAELNRGEGWRYPHSEPLRVIGAFAEGTLLADDSELGSKARAEVTAFPQALADASRHALEAEIDPVAARLRAAADHWEIAETLITGVHRAYVALFAAADYFFPGREHRAAFVDRYLLGSDVLDAELALWTAAEAPDRAERLPDAWRTFTRTVLDNT